MNIRLPRRAAPTTFLVGIALILTAIMPLSASAARVIRWSDWFTSVACADFVEGGYVTVFVFDHAEFGTIADLQFYRNFDEGPYLISSEAAVRFHPNLATVDATIQVATYDGTVDPPIGEPVGEAVLHADLVPIGEPERAITETRSGNVWSRYETERQTYRLEGSLVMPGFFELNMTGLPVQQCRGESESVAFIGSNPSATAGHFDSQTLVCEWQSDTESVALSAWADVYGSGTYASVIDASGTYYGFFSEPAITLDGLAADFPLFDEFGAEIGGASIDAAFIATGDRVRDSTADGTVTTMSEVLAVSGTMELQTPAGRRSLPLSESCVALDSMVNYIFGNPAGPKPGPLANDEPASAITLRPGHKDSVVTGGNAEAPEAPCVFTDPETSETYEIPPVYSAWWKFNGTGDTMTVDTVGSTFDTVLGVYAEEDGVLINLACVDDVPVGPDEYSLQSRVSLATQLGVTYYVQAGGFSSGGHLHVSLN